MARGVEYAEYGKPNEVLTVKERGELARPGSNEALVELLAAPVNPSDINQIEGKYPIKPPLPAVAGNEGVGVVKDVGAAVSNVKVGQWVVPLRSGLGTWREAALFPADALHPVPTDLPLSGAATLTINPPSAWRMLEEYVQLKEGDTVIQNGANSIVGQLVIQLAKLRGINTINIVRDRPDMEELTQQLKALGATVVTTEHNLREAVKEAGIDAPMLGLNCVGGSASTAVAKMLKQGGVMVTYGGMSMQPVSIPTGLLIFKDIRAHGFWLSGSRGSSDPASTAKLLDKLVPLVRDGQLQVRTEAIPLAEYQQALEPAPKALLATKRILLTDLGMRWPGKH